MLTFALYSALHNMQCMKFQARKTFCIYKRWISKICFKVNIANFKSWHGEKLFCMFSCIKKQKKNIVKKKKTKEKTKCLSSKCQKLVSEVAICGSGRDGGGVGTK